MRDALAEHAAKTTEPPRVLFTAHSIPVAMAATCRYADELSAAARWLAGEAAAGLDHELVYQSRSGPPSVPWLEPDVCDRVVELAGDGVRSVVLAPLGFVSDHMEVVHDLDTEAAQAAAEAGVVLSRAATVGVHPVFVAGLADLVAEGVGLAEPRVVDGFEVCPSPCPADCCSYERPRTRR